VITRRCLILGGLSVAASAQKAVLVDADYSGWQSYGLGLWTAQAGEITGQFNKDKPGPGYLFTREEFTDFRLTMIFQVSSGGRSGIYVREPRRRWGIDGDNRPGFGSTCGYEVRIDYQDRENPPGTINNVQKSRKSAGAEGQWNEMEIVCRGAEIRISIAGQNVNRFNQLRVQPGVIGFGVPSPASQDFIVRFREIVISSLS